MRLSIDPDEYLVQVPAPLRKRPMIEASLPDRGCKHRTEPVPPVPNRLVADVDARSNRISSTLSQRQRIADIHHHHEADHLGRAVEITEGIAHRRRLRILARWLKPIYPDNARPASSRRSTWSSSRLPARLGSGPLLFSSLNMRRCCSGRGWSAVQPNKQPLRHPGGSLSHPEFDVEQRQPSSPHPKRNSSSSRSRETAWKSGRGGWRTQGSYGRRPISYAAGST